MLILSRRFGQSVVIGDEVFCSIAGICGNQVRLGFKAPKNISIYREEIYQRFAEERQQAMATQEKDVDSELIELLTRNLKQQRTF